MIEIPALEIEDQPACPWRGMMLDCSRHFFPVERVKGFIDVLARYKFNVFHWHLTDDQGWRVEIKSRPRLTEIGAWRSGSPLPTATGTSSGDCEAVSQQDQHAEDGVPHGGFYSQEQIREVVAFAAGRGITVMPEIDLPGHLSAAVASYPEIGVTDDAGFAPRVMTRWGVFEYVLAPTPQAFAFMDDVLGEVIDLFPSPCIHIGGDEAYLGRQVWERSPLCQEFMRTHQLENPAVLERHFLLHARQLLHSAGRRLAGWDEIAEAGVPSDSLVMAWRQGGKFAAGAARAGHEIVLSPTSHLYFDRAQGAPPDEPTAFAAPFIDLEKVYSFDPVPTDFPPDLHHLIQGAQGQLWSEYLSDWDQVEYMAFPRALALAEVLWSGPNPDRWPDFQRRLRDQAHTLDAMGINACRREF
jgi:hexosaminidase